MARSLTVVAILLTLLVMVRGQQQPQFIPLPTGPMPAALIP
jgi:hypothetical protein